MPDLCESCKEEEREDLATHALQMLDSESVDNLFVGCAYCMSMVLQAWLFGHDGDSARGWEVRRINV